MKLKVVADGGKSSILDKFNRNMFKSYHTTCAGENGDHYFKLLKLYIVNIVCMGQCGT